MFGLLNRPLPRSRSGKTCAAHVEAGLEAVELAHRAVRSMGPGAERRGLLEGLHRVEAALRPPGWHWVDRYSPRG